MLCGTNSLTDGRFVAPLKLLACHLEAPRGRRFVDFSVLLKSSTDPVDIGCRLLPDRSESFPGLCLSSLGRLFFVHLQLTINVDPSDIHLACKCRNYAKFYANAYPFGTRHCVKVSVGEYLCSALRRKLFMSLSITFIYTGIHTRS